MSLCCYDWFITTRTLLALNHLVQGFPFALGKQKGVGYILNGVYQDIASGINFEKRKEFFDLVDEVLAGKVRRVVITYKDRLSRVGFELFSHLFAKHGCELIVMSDVGSTELDSEEVFDDVVNLLDSYSLTLYSKRKNKLIKELLEDDNRSTS